jgi:molybdenum cofactor biosynthesis protein B
MGHVEHKRDAPRTVRCYVITISDTRTDETDSAGRAIRECRTALSKGHRPCDRER